jgi:hypothetical protein
VRLPGNNFSRDHGFWLMLTEGIMMGLRIPDIERPLPESTCGGVS